MRRFFVPCAVQRQCLPGIVKLRSEICMDDEVVFSALDRAERALQRIERALARRQPVAARDEQLRAKVREVVEELDELIRQAAA
jgi:phosphohistidine phosphatase SixA